MTSQLQANTQSNSKPGACAKTRLTRTPRPPLTSCQWRQD